MPHPRRAHRAKLLEHVQPGDVEQLLQSKEGQVAPGTINHIRQFFVRAFNKARKAGRWLGANPAEDVDTRRVPRSDIVNILAPEEVFPFFARSRRTSGRFRGGDLHRLPEGRAVRTPEGRLDLVRRLVMARRSYERPFPKSRKQRVVRIREEFVPFLSTPTATFPGPWLFPDPRRRMRTMTWQPEDVLRRALKRAGIVTGLHARLPPQTCRFSEEREDDEIRPCPRCGFKLWPKGNVRRSGFTISGTRTRACCSCPGAARLGAEAARALGPERSPSAGTGTCCRTSWRRR